MIKGIDLYIKIILTVIAVCLVYIVAKDVKIIPEARAASSGSVMDVNIVSIDGNTFGLSDVSRFHPALPVEIKSCEYDLPVKINDIKCGILWPLPVRQE